VLRCFTCAAHAHATACRAESFVGSDAPVRAANVADQVFDAIAAEGKLNPAALQRLLTLYKSNTLESALNLVVLPACRPYAACPSGAHVLSFFQDKRMVQKLVATSGRSLYLVESSSDEPYGKHLACAFAPLFHSLFGHRRPLPRAGCGGAPRDSKNVRGPAWLG
jgi:hypothetical protein